MATMYTPNNNHIPEKKKLFVTSLVVKRPVTEKSKAGMAPVTAIGRHAEIQNIDVSKITYAHRDS